MRLSRCRLWLSIAVLGTTAAVGLGEQPAPASPPKTAGKNTSGRFSPGIQINWKTLEVEIDSTVVLRKGSLELLACSPGTREHESILTVSARPQDIYHALGLIGLEPGSPVSFDPKKETWVPPAGERLEITARYRRDQETVVVDIRDWLLDAATDRPPTDLHWVFAGSRSSESGKFGADLDGTIICVVDFDTALIAIDTARSSADENLWLRARTEAIPPIGTPCTLIIRSAKATDSHDPSAIHVIVRADGGMSHQDKRITPVELPSVLNRRQDGSANQSIVLRPTADVSKEVLDAVIAGIVAAGVAERAIRIERPPAKRPSEPSSAAPRPGG